MSLAAETDVWYRDAEGATITYTGDDNKGRPLGYIIGDGHVYDENLILVLLAHGGMWEPTDVATGESKKNGDGGGSSAEASDGVQSRTPLKV